jgi:hypothetical protein
MLFHLGAVLRLNELRVTSKLYRISSVSGGSLTAGKLGAVWKDLTFTNGVATNLADQLVVPIRQLARQTIDLRSIIFGVLRLGSTISDSVVKAYDEHLFNGAKLSAPRRPQGTALRHQCHERSDGQAVPDVTSIPCPLHGRALARADAVPF